MTNNNFFLKNQILHGLSVCRTRLAESSVQCQYDRDIVHENGVRAKSIPVNLSFFGDTCKIIRKADHCCLGRSIRRCYRRKCKLERSVVGHEIGPL